MVRSFRCAETTKIFNLQRSKKFVAIERMAQRKLKMLDDAASLNDLARVPGNRLEALKGNRKGQNSIRISDQWRVCFVWKHDGPHDVEIVDYH